MRDDQPVAVEQEGDDPDVHLVVGPDDLAGVAVQGRDITIEPDEDELVDRHRTRIRLGQPRDEWPDSGTRSSALLEHSMGTTATLVECQRAPRPVGRPA